MAFDDAFKQGRLDEARSLLDKLGPEAEKGGLSLADDYADLADAFARGHRYDDAIAAMQRAIELGWGDKPDPRSYVAEFQLKAGRGAEAASIFADLKAKDPDDVLLYQEAGLAYSEAGDHELAVSWLGDGIELAIRTEDPENVVPELSKARRRDLAALGRKLDDLERRVKEFLARPGDRGWNSAKVRARFQAEVGQLLEPDESVVCAVRLSPSPWWWTTTPTTGSYSRVAAVTQRNVYVFKQLFVGAKPKVLFKAPLGSVDASLKRSVSGTSLRIRQYKKAWLPVSSKRLWLPWLADKKRPIYAGSLDRAREVATTASRRSHDPALGS